MPPKDCPRRLLVEGIDDQFSVINLVKAHHPEWDNASWRPDVQKFEGVDRSLDECGTAAKSKNIQRLGVVLDADKAAAGRWASLTAIFSRAGLSAPGKLDSNGVVFDGLITGSRVGVWIMPDNAMPGSLESFLTALIPPVNQFWNFACEVTSEARRSHKASFSELDEPKARLHTWLAWQRKPGLPYGSAIEARYFLTAAPEALTFLTWFRRLFIEESAEPSPPPIPSPTAHQP